jgi:uncharacterized protein (DUF488 family)
MERIIGRQDVFGIGYEGQNLEEFICGLAGRGTRILADVRLNPISRKRGFSKRILAASLADAGIDYWHVPELGNPRWNRIGFAGPPTELLGARARFATMIGGEVARIKLQELAEAAQDETVAVMCFEADERACHRYVVLQELHRRLALCFAPS